MGHLMFQDQFLEEWIRIDHSLFSLYLSGYGNTYPHKIEDKVDFILDLLRFLKIDSAIIVSPSMSGEYSIPLLRSAPEVFEAFVPVAPRNTESLTKDEYNAIQVKYIMVFVCIFVQWL